MMIEGVEIIEDREPLDTHQMLMDGFLENLQRSGSDIGEPDIEPSKSVSQRYAAKKDYNTEVLLANLFEIHDEMVGLFSTVHHSSVTAQNLSESINKVGQCISLLGGKIEKFSALDHVSGLHAPDLKKNARKVLETTKQCYSLGGITDDAVDESGKTIHIVFSGDEGPVHYRAIGVITAHGGWNGNEAIDYIYTPSAGKLSVKAFEENRWVDRSDYYDVNWDLEEYDKDQYYKEKEAILAKQKEEKVVSGENKATEEIDVSFPIEEK